MPTELQYVNVDEAINAAMRTLNDGYRIIHGRDCACDYCTASQADRRCTQVCFGCFADCPTNPARGLRTHSREYYFQQKEFEKTRKYRRQLFWKTLKVRVQLSCVVICPGCGGTLKTRHLENCGYRQSDQMEFEQQWRAHERGDCKKCLF